MSKQPDFDTALAHKFFAADCFNKAWDFIDKQTRTPEENENMLLLAQASLWHWTQRDDRTNRNLSVGFWQVSRIYSLLGQDDNARLYGKRCLELSEGEQPFYQGYAHEALARAEMVAGNKDVMAQHLFLARNLADNITDSEEQKILLSDIENIG